MVNNTAWRWQRQALVLAQIKDWLRNNVDSPDETPEGLSQDSLNLLSKIDEWEEEDIA